MKKTLIAAIMFAPLFANAASIGPVTPQTKNIVIGAPNSFTHTLTPVSGLIAGDITGQREVAAGEVRAVAGSNPAQYAVQFASGGNNTAPTAGLDAAIKGTNNAANVLLLVLAKDASMTMPTAQASLNGTQWMVYGQANSFKYVVNTTSPSLKADTYPVTINAAVYTP
ncbi:TPA: hypothetical protein ACOEAZ_004448 [Enterobacter asburiae]